MDFRDCRGMKVVLVPHCELNQNSRLAGCAEVPAAVSELVAGLMERGVGVVQMPCPELMTIGLDRDHVHIRDELEKPPARAACRRMAAELCYQIAQYLAGGLLVLGVLGKNGSPACGVEETWRAERGPGRGVFIEEFTAEMTARGLDLPLTGTMDAQPGPALAAVDRWLDAAPARPTTPADVP